MKVLFFILALTFSTYGKPVENIHSGRNISNAEPQSGNKEVVYQKAPRQDEDGDDGDEGGLANGLANGLGNILGGASGSGGSSSVTGLLLNGLTGGLFASFIPGETGQAVSNLYSQFTDPINKILESQINIGLKNLLVTTTQKAKVKATLAPTTPQPQSNVVIQEVTIQEVNSPQFSNQGGGGANYVGGSNQGGGGANYVGGFNQGGGGANYVGGSNQGGGEANYVGGANQVGGAALAQSGGFTLLSAEKLSNSGYQQNPQQQNNGFSPLANAIAGQPGVQNEIRRKEPYITNLADLKYINGQQQSYTLSSTPLPGGNHAPTAPPSNNQQFQGTQSSNNVERTTTEDDDGEDGDDEDVNRS